MKNPCLQVTIYNFYFNDRRPATLSVCLKYHKNSYFFSQSSIKIIKEQDYFLVIFLNACLLNLHNRDDNRKLMNSNAIILSVNGNSCSAYAHEIILPVVLHSVLPGSIVTRSSITLCWCCVHRSKTYVRRKEYLPKSDETFDGLGRRFTKHTQNLIQVRCSLVKIAQPFHYNAT